MIMMIIINKVINSHTLKLILEFPDFREDARRVLLPGDFSVVGFSCASDKGVV
jgi:hypothetical protein